MSEANEYLRINLIPEMLKSVAYNQARKLRDIHMFEIGSIFLSEEEKVTKQTIEHERLAAVMTGDYVDHKWTQSKTTVDFFVIKGVLEGLFTYLDLQVEYKQAKLA